MERSDDMRSLLDLVEADVPVEAGVEDTIFEAFKGWSTLSESYRYAGNCTGLAADDLHDMMDKARQVTYSTFVKAIGLDQLRELFADYGWGHQRGFVRMKTDPHITYYRSIFKGKHCYYVRESGIEYIFVDDDKPSAEMQVKPNRFTITADGAVIKGFSRGVFNGAKTPDSLKITWTSTPSSKAAETLTRMVRQSKLEEIILDDEPTSAENVIAQLKRFL
jgi:hypothetical protein